MGGHLWRETWYNKENLIGFKFCGGYYMKTELSPLFSEALNYATEVHRNQSRKGSGVPYISHLLAVCAIVLEYGGNEIEAIAALLHDAPEDQGGRERLAEIRAKFGEPVAAIVAGCTDAWTEPKPPWRRRKEEYLAQLKEASPSVLLVSVADKLHNSRTILADYHVSGATLWERFAGRREGTLWYYRAIIAVYRQTIANPRLVDELDRVVSELELLVSKEIDDE
jgi:(p)ppGpp synthase/HD superfamily hydrolase